MSLHVNRVHKRYDSKQVLNNISFTVEAHEFVCILGHSGCGKSTLLNLIAGYLQADEGNIEFNRAPIKGPAKSRGVVFQEHALFPWYTVMENISFGPEVQGVPKSKARENARNYLKLIGLEQYADHYPHQLSGGMKQRVGIARALAGEPEVLLMDEPFGALDILTRETMQRELLKIWMELRPMVIFITHSISEAIYLADKIIVMKDGGISEMYKLTMARPRSKHDPEFIRLQEEIEALLIDEGAHV
ncbi:ABC transporter ATP-binding protein [Paenibacillus sp. sgz302251]|uniref:ABC transporter ATP-binding protein n=1 Tax=Paenibacillus sp. sgz302251 TaxID=3414493 RepID=UPI003C7ECAB4